MPIFILQPYMYFYLETGLKEGFNSLSVLAVKVPFTCPVCFIGRGFRGEAGALIFRIHPPNLPPDETYGTGEREALIKITEGCSAVGC